MAESNSSAPPQQNVNTKSSPPPESSPTTKSSPPPESSPPLPQSTPPPSASPPPPNTPPPPEPSPPPPPSSSNNSSSPNINQSPPPNQNSSSPTGKSPPSPSPSSSTPSPPPPSPSSSPPPPPSPPAPSTNSSSPSDSGISIESPPTPVPPSGSGSNYPPPPSSTGLSPGSYSISNGQSNSPSQSTSRGGSGNTATYVGYAIVGVFFVALVAVTCVCFTWRKRKQTKYNAPYASHSNFPIKPDGVNTGEEGFYGSQPRHSSHGSNFKNANPIGNMHHSSTSDAGIIGSQIVFSFDNILEITNGFSHENVIGEGGFGCVYKALLPDGRVGAVKQLKAGSGQGEREFKAEVEIISRVHHRHLVSLVGYCISEQQRILVYEFVPNKTLDHHLHGKGVQVLDWAKRVKIAIGAAKGLAYLHEDCHPKIIHRDIKSSNILLDDSFEAQVADFGLAKLNVDANTHVTTRVMGTFGYLAPEYATSGKLTDRSDVYSFGVVLLELITGRKPVDKTQPIGDESLVEWARPLLLHAVETGDCSQVIDPKLTGNFVESEILRMIDAAAACTRHSAPKRPSMLQVVRALDSREDLSDLSNGVKYGQSVVYNSDRYNADILRLMNNSFGSSEFDIYSGEYNSKEYSGTQNSLAAGSSSGESETRALNKHSFRTQHMNVQQQT